MISEPPMMCGGVGGVSQVDAASLDVWKTALDKNAWRSDIDVLQALGTPVSVRTQVVSGTNYFFTFGCGSEVTVWSQPWTNKCEITSPKAGPAAPMISEPP